MEEQLQKFTRHLIRMLNNYDYNKIFTSYITSIISELNRALSFFNIEDMDLSLNFNGQKLDILFRKDYYIILRGEHSVYYSNDDSNLDFSIIFLIISNFKELINQFEKCSLNTFTNRVKEDIIKNYFNVENEDIS